MQLQLMQLQLMQLQLMQLQLAQLQLAQLQLAPSQDKPQKLPPQKLPMPLLLQEPLRNPQRPSPLSKTTARNPGRFEPKVSATNNSRRVNDAAVGCEGSSNPTANCASPYEI
jgi:hypothetical protein